MNLPRLPIRVLFLLLIASTWVTAQEDDAFPVLSGLGGLNEASSLDPKVEVSAKYRLTADGSQGELSVTADLGKGWHIYSVTQKPGGPMRTTIDVATDGQIEFSGPYQPDAKPDVKKMEFFDVPVEEHPGPITWTAPFRVNDPANAKNLVLRGKVGGQICNESGACVPLSTLETEFVASRAGTLKSAPLAVAQPRRTPPVQQVARVSPFGDKPLNFQAPGADGFRLPNVHATIQGNVSAAETAGSELQLVVTIAPDPGWHVYAYAEKDPKAISKPTLIAVVEPGDWMAGQPRPSSEPIVKSTGLSIEPLQEYHEGPVSWTVPVTVPAATAAGRYTIKGMVGYQTCTESRCDMPVAVAFAAEVEIGAAASNKTVPLKFAMAKYSAVAKFAETGAAPPPGSDSTKSSAGAAQSDTSFDLSKIVVRQNDRSLGSVLMLAFVGGFILNFMPCVLPVIGLKIMAFVDQAGKDRGRVFMLNAWYSLGMLSIFLILATLASAASLGLSSRSLGWGEQFNYDGFTIPLLAVIFVMGLSFLGVWEIPIPGFVGGGKANELAAKEGVMGAFCKGIITTILATPCSGPGLATALTWSATQPPQIVYLVFTAMGLGMSFPYLVIGAFPQLVRFIPKPGPWMDTFKQLMGFVLMGTVVYMFTLVEAENVIPTLALIFALWASCWWVGRLPIGADLAQKLRGWAGAALFAGLIGYFAFGYEGDSEHELPWQDFSLATLDENVKAGRTILVDFTADW